MQCLYDHRVSGRIAQRAAGIHSDLFPVGVHNIGLCQALALFYLAGSIFQLLALCHS